MILGTFLVLGVTGFFTEAVRIALVGRPAFEKWSFIGYPLSGIVKDWSAQGLKSTEKLAALDSGCVWGGKLTALRLEDRALFQVPCAGYQAPGGEA